MTAARRTRAGFAGAAALALAACGGGTSTPQDAAPGDALALDAAPPLDAGGHAIVAGERVGPIALGMRWADVVAAIGPPPAEPVVLVRLGHAAWPALGLEALLTSPSETTLTDDAVVIGAGATAGLDTAGPVRPGAERAAIEAALGVAAESYGGRDFYPTGLAVEYGTGTTALRVGVVAAYTLAPVPPPMGPAQLGSPP